MNVNNRTGIPDLEREIRQLRKNNAELMEIGDARETAMRVFGADNDALRAEVQRLTGDLALSMAGKAMLNKSFDELQAVMEAEIERLTLNLKLCKDDSTEMDRRRLAEDARLRAENTRLREELIRMIDTFSGMGSAIPGPAFGSGAIKKARAALMAVQE